MKATGFWVQTSVLAVAIVLLVILIVHISRGKNASYERIDQKPNETFMDSSLANGVYQSRQDWQQGNPVEEEMPKFGSETLPRLSDQGDFKMTPAAKAYREVRTPPPMPKEAKTEVGLAPATNPDLEEYMPVNQSTTRQAPTTLYPQDTVMPEDLLPKDAANSKWSQMNPPVPGSVSDQNFLQAGVNIGIDTIGTSHKNPWLSIRSQPPVPKIPGLTPFYNSPIDQTVPNARSFEIGGC